MIGRDPLGSERESGESSIRFLRTGAEDGGLRTFAVGTGLRIRSRGRFLISLFTFRQGKGIGRMN